MHSFRALALLVCLAVAGCGGGGGGDREQSTGGNSPAPEGNQVIPAQVQYVALGDSLAAGAFAAQGYVWRYAAYLGADTGTSVSLTNLGRGGWKSADLLQALQNDPAMRQAVASAHVVTWNIGGNDLLRAYGQFQRGTCGGANNTDCFRAAVDQFKSNWDAIVREILSLRRPENTILRTMDVYNPFVAEEKRTGTFDRLRVYLDEVNGHIAASASANGIPFARVYHAFNGPNGDVDANTRGYMSPDLIHPNDTGHAVIADLLRGLGYAPFRKR